MSSPIILNPYSKMAFNSSDPLGLENTKDKIYLNDQLIDIQI